MQPINTILNEIMEYYDNSPTVVAKELGVSPTSINRWLNGKTTPRAAKEGRIRELHRAISQPIDSRLTIAESQAAYALRLFEDKQSLRDNINEALREVREALHRRGRLSSRNQAIDELSKLLFAHIMTPGGISYATVPNDNGNMATSLVTFVEEAFKRYLPTSLGHEMSLTDFQLALKTQENDLAFDIVQIFETLADKNISLSIAQGYDVLNEIFGSFLADSFINEKELGQYLTPSVVVNFMVNLAVKSISFDEFDKLCHPEECVEHSLILDPSCGVASFLTELVRVLTPEVFRRHGKQGLQTWSKNMVSNVLVGLDKSERMVRLALTNMALFGFPAANLHLCDALSRTGGKTNFLKGLENKVQLILTNPPFGAEVTGNDLKHFYLSTRWADRSVTKVNSELLFIERYLDWLKPGGQFFAIVPDSILTNKGIYADLRQGLASMIEVCSVISLPDVTFAAAGTNTKTSILHIRKSASPKCKNTFFAICNDIGYSVKTKNAQRTKKINDNGTGELLTILDDFSTPLPSSSLTRRVENVTQTSRWDATYHISLPSEVEALIKNPTENDIFVRDVADLVNERTDPRRWGKDSFRYIEISDINSETCEIVPKCLKCTEAPSRARKVVRVGDVLFSTVRPERRTVGVVNKQHDGSVCSTGIAVLRPKNIQPVVLANLLKTDLVNLQVVRNTLGIAYPAIEEQCLLDILLPIDRHTLSSTVNIAVDVVELQEQLEKKRNLLSSVLNEAVYHWNTKNVVEEY
jgi:type I restriction-modification system DNA methylase subunit